MTLRFSTLNYILYSVWALYGLFIGYTIVDTVQQLRPVTMTDVYTDSSGPTGLIKNYYLKSYHHGGPALIRKGSDTTREYGGFTLARLLYPTNAINKAGTATIYVKTPVGNTLIPFAAKAGTKPAGPFRLWLDVSDWVILRFYWLHLLFFLATSFMKDVYQKLNRGQDIEAEVKAFYDQSNLPLLGMIAFFASLLI
jgi:hypothetical protein